MQHEHRSAQRCAGGRADQQVGPCGRADRDAAALGPAGGAAAAGTAGTRTGERQEPKGAGGRRRAAGRSRSSAAGASRTGRHGPVYGQADATTTTSVCRAPGGRDLSEACLAWSRDRPRPHRLPRRGRGRPARARRPGAVLREDQWTAIEALVADRRRALVVQRTGWGKSAVYFVATALLRARGAGPTVLVSPLLALMRNQVAAAERAGIRAVTVNSHQRRAVAGGLRRGRARRGRRAAGQPRAAQQPRLPRRRAAPARRDRRAARRRRGALHQRLGPRLPARLPPAAHPARRAAGRHARCWPPPPRPTPGWSPTSPSSSAAGDRPSCCAAARARVAAPVGGPAALARRTGWPGWPTPCPALPGSGIVYTLTVAGAEDVAPSCAAAASPPPPTPAAPTTPSAGRPRTTCSPTGSRRWSRPAPSAWASTSPTSASSSTSARPPPPSPTTSRSAAPAAASTAPRWCCCPAPTTRRSGATSPRSASRRRSRCARCSPPCSPTARCPPRRSRRTSTCAAPGSRRCSRCSTSTARCTGCRAAGCRPGRTGPTTPTATPRSPPTAPPSSRRCATTPPPTAAGWSSCAASSTTREAAPCGRCDTCTGAARATEVSAGGARRRAGRARPAGRRGRAAPDVADRA